MLHKDEIEKKVVPMISSKDDLNKLDHYCPKKFYHKVS